jgi:hypothetical protein
MKILKLCALAGLIFSLTLGTARAQLGGFFGFENLGINSVGMTTPFAVGDDNGGPITMSVSDSSGGSFFIGDNLDVTDPPGQWSNLHNFILTQPVGIDPGFQTLYLSFSHAINSFLVDFGLFDPGSLSVWNEIGQRMTFNGVVDPNSGLPEGQASLNSLRGFKSVWLSSTSQYFAVDNIRVQQVVPEPGTFVFALAAALPLAWKLRRRA